MQKTTYFGEAELDDLNRMMSDITAHLKALSADLNPLIAELRAALPIAEGRAQNALVMDLSNLVEGLRGVLSLKTSGVMNENIHLAEADLRRLVLDMRQQCARHIGERSRQVRVLYAQPAPVSDTVLPLKTEKAS